VTKQGVATGAGVAQGGARQLQLTTRFNRDAFALAFQGDDVSVLALGDKPAVQQARQDGGDPPSPSKGTARPSGSTPIFSCSMTIRNWARGLAALRKYVVRSSGDSGRAGSAALDLSGIGEGWPRAPAKRA